MRIKGIAVIDLNHLFPNRASAWNEEKQNIYVDYIAEKLAFSTKMRLHSDWAFSASKVVQDVTTKSPTQADKYRAAVRKAWKPVQKMSPNVALSLVYAAKLTKTQHQNIRLTTIKFCNSRVFPRYKGVLEAKKRWNTDKITVLETCSEIELQSLLNHTSSRILELQNEVIDQLDSDIRKNLLLKLKWGFDESSGQEEYKQNFTDRNSYDSSVFWLPLFLCNSLVSIRKQNWMLWFGKIRDLHHLCFAGQFDCNSKVKPKNRPLRKSVLLTR